jgi:uncharacterized membrane protein YoaK (UPF0700 family)
MQDPQITNYLWCLFAIGATFLTVVFCGGMILIVRAMVSYYRVTTEQDERLEHLRELNRIERCKTIERGAPPPARND